MRSKNTHKLLLFINIIFLIIFSLVIVFCLFVNINFYIESTGVIEPKEQILIKAENDGIIEKIFIEEGRKIKKGEPILSLNSPRINVEKERILAQFKEAEFIYNTYKELYSKGIISKRELLEKEKDLKVAKAEMEKLDSYVLKAPKGGFVLCNEELKLRKGDYIKKGELIAKIVNFDKLIVRSYVSEDKISKVKIGQKALIEIKGLPSYRNMYKGRVIKIVPEGKNRDSKVVFEVLISIEEPIKPFNFSESFKIYPMMNAKIKILYNTTTLFKFLLQEKIGL